MKGSGELEKKKKKSRGGEKVEFHSQTEESMNIANWKELWYLCACFYGMSELATFFTKMMNQDH